MSRRGRSAAPRTRTDLDAEQISRLSRLRIWGHDAITSRVAALVEAAWQAERRPRSQRPEVMLGAATAILTLLAVSGELTPRLGIADLAAETGYSPRTIKRAHKWLRVDGRGLLLRDHRGTKETGVSVWRLHFRLTGQLVEHVQAVRRGRRRRGYTARDQWERPGQTKGAKPAHVVGGSARPAPTPALPAAVTIRDPGPPADPPPSSAAFREALLGPLRERRKAKAIAAARGQS